MIQHEGKRQVLRAGAILTLLVTVGSGPDLWKHVFPGEAPAAAALEPRFVPKERIRFKKVFQQDALQLRVSDYALEKRLGDAVAGGFAAHSRGNVTLGGLGTHAVSIDLQSFPAEADREDTLIVKDETTGDIRVFTADHEFRRFTVRHGGQMIRVRMNPDGSWMVGGEPAPTTALAAQLLHKSTAFAGISPHTLAGVYTHLSQVFVDEPAGNQTPCQPTDKYACPPTPGVAYGNVIGLVTETMVYTNTPKLRR